MSAGGRFGEIPQPLSPSATPSGYGLYHSLVVQVLNEVCFSHFLGLWTRVALRACEKQQLLNQHRGCSPGASGVPGHIWSSAPLSGSGSPSDSFLYENQSSEQ